MHRRGLYELALEEIEIVEEDEMMQDRRR
jgi:hypothetical protein